MAVIVALIRNNSKNKNASNASKLGRHNSHHLLHISLFSNLEGGKGASKHVTKNVIIFEHHSKSGQHGLALGKSTDPTAQGGCPQGKELRYSTGIAQVYFG